ncbi:Mg2+ transporter [Phlyctema vagabunda]|uniref:Mg2+ transporter n=1 Tax=Phlyctema vagabunda TaxID=108571 RepID=A0ABR4P4D8_9HELO
MSRYRERYSASPPRRRDYYEADIRIDPEDGYGPYRPRRRDSSITRPQRAAKVQKLNNRTRFITQTRPNASHSYGALDDQYEVPLPSSRYELRREYKQRSPGERLMRRASPEKYVREIIADESDLDFDSGSEARSEASFVLDIPGQDAAMDENTDPLYSTSFGSQVQEKPRRSDQGSYTETVHKVLRSRWLGDGRASDAVAELTAGHGQISSLKTDSQFDMRWIHLESQCPSFDYFVDYVQKIPGLNEDLKQDTIALLEQSRNHELPIYTSEGPRGKHFESFLDQELVARAKKKDTEKRIQLLCLPYFSLASYSGYNLPKMSTLHPTQTLLQYSSASTTRKRELDQAVCKLSHTTKGHCFHIPKIWCLILDSELLLTCSHLPISEVVERDLIKIKPLPTLQSNAAEPVLSISDAGGRVWKLPAKDCKSWFVSGKSSQISLCATILYRWSAISRSRIFITAGAKTSYSPICLRANARIDTSDQVITSMGLLWSSGFWG